MEEKINQNVGKKSKKKVVISTVIIVVIAFLIAGGFIFYHGNQTGKLISEVNKMSEIQIVNEDGSLVEAPLDLEIKTTGSYAVVEETLKNYMNEIVTETQNLVETLDEQKIMDLVSFDNIKEDGPNFTKSKEEITKLKESVNSYVSKIESLANEEDLLAKIDDKNIGEYYKELYRQLAIDEESSANLKNAIEILKNYEEQMVQALEDLESILNFLSENKDEWQIENNQIVFTTESAYEEYTNLMETLPTMQ